MSKCPNCGWDSVEPLPEPICKTCRDVINGQLWAVCGHRYSTLSGRRVDPGVDSCGEYRVCEGERC